MTSPHAITDGMELLDEQYYAENGPPHDVWTKLRAESPVHWCDGIRRIEPFWAVTRHEDICWIGSHPDLFISEPGITPLPRDPADRLQSDFDSMRVVISTDPPEHRKLRRVASPWFTPRALRRIDAAVEQSARELVDALGPEGETDLARGMAVSHPLRILSTALGVAREHEERILELSNRLFAAADPDLGAGNRPEDFQKLGQEFVSLFLPIIEDRRKHPTDDLASLLANGEIDGQPMGPMETLGYYLIIFNAGHDTTKNALAGGFRALIENPAAFDAVRADASRAPDAVEEILRWTSSVNYMKRTAVRDVELRGQKIRAGDALILFYGSGNRDEAIFDAPFTFDIGRKPNRHVAFGYGEHFCMGAHMARRSMRALLQELARRVVHWEITGEPQWITSSFVIGLKSLPVRYRIAAG